jgi:hypothetical protein
VVNILGFGKDVAYLGQWEFRVHKSRCIEWEYGNFIWDG